MIEIGLFAEDDGHRSLLVPLVHRLAELEHAEVEVSIRNAHGGHGPAVASLKQFVRDQRRGIEPFYDILIPAIDANCTGVANRLREVNQAVGESYAGQIVPALPEPHIELWYIADPAVVGRILDTGTVAVVPPVKCERNRYKKALREAFLDAGVETLAGGVEYGEDIAVMMDLDVASQTAASFGVFVRDLCGAIRVLRGPAA